jgi:putrescine transport system ATP-binding protein
MSTSSNGQSGFGSGVAAASDPSQFLHIRDVVKDFNGYKAVNNVSIDIAKGEIFALLGSSGCGKSTLLRMLAGFETPTSGRIVLNGQDLSTLPPYERPMNMMFQSYALFPHLTVWENIAFGLRRGGLPKDQIQTQVEAMLKLVQLGKFGQRKPHQLSGGQQQRVALARSLAKKPQLLLLDEPLGALDKKLREETQIELVNIIENVGVTCVMVTHDQEEAMTMASRLAVMSEGRFMQVGAPGDIYETPATRFVADFIGNVNLMEGTLSVDQVDHVIIDCADCQHYVGHGITGTEGMPVTVALRPEKIRIGRDLLPPVDGEPAGGLNRVQGTVKDLSYFGSFTVYHLALASGLVLKISASNTERHRADELTWGDTAWASWSPEAHVVLTS